MPILDMILNRPSSAACRNCCCCLTIVAAPLAAHASSIAVVSCFFARAIRTFCWCSARSSAPIVSSAS